MNELVTEQYDRTDPCNHLFMGPGRSEGGGSPRSELADPGWPGMIPPGSENMDDG